MQTPYLESALCEKCKVLLKVCGHVWVLSLYMCQLNVYFFRHRWIKKIPHPSTHPGYTEHSWILKSDWSRANSHIPDHI